MDESIYQKIILFEVIDFCALSEDACKNRYRYIFTIFFNLALFEKRSSAGVNGARMRRTS
jgi:hypothetical protein